MLESESFEQIDLLVILLGAGRVRQLIEDDFLRRVRISNVHASILSSLDVGKFMATL